LGLGFWVIARQKNQNKKAEMGLAEFAKYPVSAIRLGVISKL